MDIDNKIVMPAVGFSAEPGACGCEVFEVTASAPTLYINYSVLPVNLAVLNRQRALVGVQMAEENHIYLVLLVEGYDLTHSQIAMIGFPLP